MSASSTALLAVSPPVPLAQKSAVVIGAGVGGLAAAIRLRRRGYAVTVLEANGYSGGKLTAFEQDGFRFDAGPSLFTMPHLVDELFELCGRSPRGHFDYTPLEVACRYFYEDGTTLTAYVDRERFADEVEHKLGVPRARLLEYLDRSRRMYERTKGVFLERSLHRLGTYVSRDALRAFVALPSLALLSTMDGHNRRLLGDPRLVMLFNRFATYNGSSPYRAPGVLTMIPHLEHGIGAYFPRRGMHEITQSLTALAEDQGVRFRFRCPVERIVVDAGRARGVRLSDGEELSADVVVSNADIVPTYRRLLPDQPAPERALARPRSSSAVIFYWGVARQSPELDVHNIFFSGDYEREFQQLFDEHTLGDDPTVYVHVSSKVVPTDAPAGAESWFVMVNAPANSGQRWDELVARARVRILDKLRRRLGVDVAPLIRTEAVLDPVGIEARTSSHAGALYGASSNDAMAAFLRHPNFSPRLRGLYFCGGSVHPGGGIPLCLLSAKIVSEMVS